jgi:hypothetical protein
MLAPHHLGKFRVENEVVERKMILAWLTAFRSPTLDKSTFGQTFPF